MLKRFDCTYVCTVYMYVHTCTVCTHIRMFLSIDCAVRGRRKLCQIDQGMVDGTMCEHNNIIMDWQIVVWA